MLWALSVGAAPSARHTAPMVLDSASFDDVVLPHIDAAYRLARRLMRDHSLTDDVVQEASLRLSILPNIWRWRWTCVVPQNRSQHLLRLAPPSPRR